MIDNTIEMLLEKLALEETIRQLTKCHGRMDTEINAMCIMLENKIKYIDSLIGVK